MNGRGRLVYSQCYEMKYYVMVQTEARLQTEIELIVGDFSFFLNNLILVKYLFSPKEIIDFFLEFSLFD